MHDASTPDDPGPSKRAPRIAAELKRQVRASRRANQRAAAWSVPVGAAPDSELDKVLELLARVGVHGTYERELGFIAHFLMTW